MTAPGSGPLAGVRVVELAGLGPGPFTGMMLADLGADVVRVDRISSAGSVVTSPANVLRRGRYAVSVDLRSARGREVVLDLADWAEAFFEPFRPGVAERLGVGPEECFARNPALVYGRMTGWGQLGPLATEPGHDINYIALAGALHPLGRPDTPPLPPLNLIGDFAGGGMMLAFGIVCALLEARASGVGQVIDASMVDGSALLMGMFHSLRALGMWEDQRGRNELDGASHYYQVYETADGGYVSVGAIEPEFYANLLGVLGLAPGDYPQADRSRWPEFKAKFAELFLTKTRDDWCAAFAGREACVAPVLSMAEAPAHPHNRERGTFLTAAGVVQPAPAPRFSRTPGAVRWASPPAGEHTEALLTELLGYPPELVAELRAEGVVS